MRLSSLAFVLALSPTCFAPAAPGQPAASLADRLAARQQLEAAKYELRYYWQVEYPRRVRDLDGAIELTRMAIDNNNSLLREYRPYTRFSIGQPFPVTIRNLQMCQKENELRLNNLLDERNNLMRFHGAEFRVLEAKVYEARLRVAELEANDTIEATPSTETLPAPK